MDFPFRERVRNFHDSNLLVSFSIRKFQLRLRKSQLDMVKKIPRTLMKSVLHFMITGPSVLPAMKPNHMPSVLSKFNLDPKSFSNIRTISKALLMEYSSAKVRSPSSAYWLILDSSDEPYRRTPLISLQFLIAAPRTSATRVYSREEMGSPWRAPRLISKKEVTKPECRQAEEILVYITLIHCLNSGPKFILCNTRSRKFQFTLSNAFSWSRPMIARGRFLELQYSIRSLTRFRYEKIDLLGTPQVWSSCKTEDKTFCDQAARTMVPIL